MCSKDGVLLSGPKEIKDRWVEHFSDLLNLPSDVHFTVVNEFNQLPMIKSMDRPIEDQELDLAISNTKLGKSLGSDGILPVVVVHGSCRLKVFLLTLFNIIWMTEIIPPEWKDATITTLLKKGDTGECETTGEYLY